METKETIIFEVDVTSYEKSLALLSNSINALKADQKAYLEDSKKGIAGAAEAYEKVTVQLKNQQQAYRTTQAALQGYVAGQKSGVDVTNLANNSIQQNRDLLKQLTAQYINTKNPSEAFTKQIKSVSDALKQQEGAIGDTRRNVGNYAEGFKGALSAITSTIPALGGFKTAQLGVNAAMDANPIGAVILLLQGLVEIFKNNAEVADQVSFAFAAVNKAVGSIIDTVVNTVSSLDNLTQALAHPIDFIFNLGKNMAKAAKEGYEAAKALDAFELSAGRIDRAIQKNQVSIDALTKSLKDRTKTEKDRIAIANQIADTEIKNADLIIQKNQELLNAENLRLKGKTLNATEQNKLEQLIADVQNAELEKQIVNAQRQTRINILLDKQNTASAKANSEERIKIRQTEVKSIEEIILKEQQLKDNAYQNETDRELAALVRREELIAEKTANPIALIEAETLKRNLLLQQEELTATERENIVTQSELNILKIKQDAANRDIKISTDTAASKNQVLQAELAFASSVSSSMIGFISDVANASGAGAQFQKVLAGIEIGVKTAVALAGAISQAQSVPFPANLAAIAAGIGAVLGGIGSAVTLLKSTPDVPKFAKGVIGLDGEGTETSDSVPAMLSRGESVVTAKATKKYHRELAWMEQSVGNTPNYKFGSGKFANGLIGGISTNAGFDTREIATSAMQRAEITFAIKEAMLSAPAPVVSVKEFNRVNLGVQRSVRVSEV